MTILPVKSTVPPSDLIGQPNGHIDGVLLVQLLPETASLARLHHTVARGWLALADAALKAGGWTLWWTSVADTYRTYEVQLAVFLARYEPVSQTTYNAAPSANRKRWPAAPALGYASEFWIKRNIGTPSNPKYPATAAVPGTSNHGIGCAIDGALKTSAGIVGWTPGSPQLTWLIANARRFGFAWSLQDEPWHIQWIMGDVIPQAVLDYENPPQPEPDPQEEDMLNKILVPAYPGVPATYPHLGAFDSGLVRPLVSGDIAPEHGIEQVEDEGQYRRLCAWAHIALD